MLWLVSYCLLKVEEQRKLTEAVKNVKHANKRHSNHVHRSPPFTQVKRALGEILPSGNDVRQERDPVGHRRQDNERPSQIEERRRTTEGNSPEGKTEDTDEHRGRDGAAERLVDAAEDAGERDRVVTGQSPVDARVCEGGAYAAQHRGAPDDEQEAEGCAEVLAAVRVGGGLGVDACEGVGVDSELEGADIGDAVADGDSEEEGICEAIVLVAFSESRFY